MYHRVLASSTVDKIIVNTPNPCTIEIVMDTIRLAVIGAGYWGKNLVRNFAQLKVLQTICDNDQTLLNSFKKNYSVKYAADWKEVLKDKSINAVAIATPAVSHYKIAKQALLAKKDVFVEKPLALNVKEAEELIALAAKEKRILMADHILQYHPAVVKLKTLIDKGVLGKLQYIYSHRLNIGKLRREENILWSFAPHDISVILRLVGQEPKKVRAFGEAYLQKGIYDTTMTDLTFHDRLKAHIFVSWLHPFKEQKLVVIGDKNMAVFNDLEEKNKLLLYPHKVRWVNRIPVADKAQAQIIPLEKKEPLKEACLHFLDCVKKRKTPQTDGREALAVLKILKEAQSTLDKGRGNGR